MGTESIETRGEDGRRVLVIKIRSRIDTSDMDGDSSIEGAARHVLADGRVLNVTKDGFEVVATGELLVRA